jgi:hypothetical protein
LVELTDRKLSPVTFKLSLDWPLNNTEAVAPTPTFGWMKKENRRVELNRNNREAVYQVPYVYMDRTSGVNCPLRTSTSDSDHFGQDAPWRFDIRQPDRLSLSNRIQRHSFAAPEYLGLDRDRGSHRHMVPGT